MVEQENLPVETKDFSKLCRCCLKSGSIQIFETVFEALSLATIIEKCTHSTISPEDHLPKNICQVCFDQLAMCYLFITRYLKAQGLLDVAFTEKVKADNVENINTKMQINSSDSDIETGYTSNHEDNDISNISINRKLANMQSSDNEKPLSSLRKSKLKFCKSFLGENHNFNCNKNKTSSLKHLGDKTKTVELTNKIRTKKKYFCPKCNECFNFIKLLEKHCRDTMHPIPRRYHCETCTMKFLTKSCLKAHLRIHSNEKPHTCNECGMKFSLSSNLQRHKRRHTGEKAFFCEVCGRGFIQKHTLVIHMRLHNGETPYVCQECGKGYRAKPLLTQHLKKHNGLDTYYREHYLKHGSQKVECGICKKLLTKSGLYTHMKVQHGDGLKKFLCNLCGKTYTSKKSLETHMNVHTKKIIYNCEVCSKSFSHHNYLKTHMRIHSGEKPHCCDICGKTFTQHAHLDGHMRTHTGARPYVCTYCKKSFALSGNLKVHLRIHTGETPYRCTVCNKGFVDSSNKKKHESTVHQMHQDNVQ